MIATGNRCFWPYDVSTCARLSRDLRAGVATNELIRHDLDATGHGGVENGALFRPIRNNRTGRLDKTLTLDAVYRRMRGHSAVLGFEIGAHALRATAATNALDL